ncbi:glycosyltransferase family 4 protein [Flavobacteriaceae bacterium]|nr:glycosyltransferase family 4 protein [Flavobacteriaceae bacterium]MDB4203664.1 glycosyltransferase family 4 protein [Flavobacteriaceae bacterium]
MKILHITNNYPTTKHPIFGIFVKEQIDSLNTLDFKNEVLFINGREKGKFEYLRSILKIRKKLKHENYDLIHCHHALSALCLIFSGKNINSKILVSFQNDPIHELGSKVFNFIKRNTNGWIFKNNSDLITDELSFYLPNGVNTSFFKPMDKQIARKHLKLNRDAIYLLFVSSNKIRKQKRYDRFSQTVTILKEKYKINNVQEIKLINTSRDKIPFYFNAVDIHLLSSEFEGSPNSVKESMACNTSVVSTNVGNVSELLKNVKGSHVSEGVSPEELAFLVDKALRDKCENGLERLIELELDIDSVALKLKNIYIKLIN